MAKKTFCIAGPIREEIHYFLPQRLDRKMLLTFVDRMYYFVLHAPRQSGKTTAINQFVRYLQEQNTYNALFITVEDASVVRDDVKETLLTIVGIFRGALARRFGAEHELLQKLDGLLKSQRVSVNVFREALEYWAQLSPLPVVLFIDEIDSLVGDALLSVLNQIRAGFDGRPGNFPQSLCLIGLRDLRDYRVWSKSAHHYVSTSSPFNIKAVSLTLSNFTLKEVSELYLQHTHETGQIFTEEALAYANCVTQGQPWLVNALAQEACFSLVLDRSKPITKEVIEQAKAILIRRRDTHIDSLVEKLQEPRVREVIDSIIHGSVIKPEFIPDDIQYVIDLGLISATSENFQIANPIYKEIIPVVLGTPFQKSITESAPTYQRADGSIDMSKLLMAFTQFFRENSQVWLQDFSYKDSGPHILMMAFLQRVINAGGTIHREYALGKKRVDLLIAWKQQKIVIELKMKYGEDTLAKGLEQTACYMDSSGATEGHLVIFDRDATKSWDEKISHERLTYESKEISVWTL